jgi:hypothetical protein
MVTGSTPGEAMSNGANPTTLGFSLETGMYVPTHVPLLPVTKSGRESNGFVAQ